MRAWYGILLAGWLFWLVACGANRAFPTPDPLSHPPDGTISARATEILPNGAALDATKIPTVELVPSIQGVTPPTPAATPDATQPVALTLWVPEEFAPGAEHGGDVLETQLAEFRTAHPNITVNYVMKAPYGKGGIVDWLTQLHELMPERMPDAVILDSRELDRLAAMGLPQSLNRDLPSGAYWDLFSPAQQIARQSGTWDNEPLVLDTEHLVYDANRVAKPPLTWADVLTTTTQFAFAADSTESFLFQYLEGNGTLDPSEHPALDAGVMQGILEYYQRARANGNLNETAAVMKSARDIMPLLVNGQTPMAQVRARDFLAEQSRLPNARAAAIPTQDGKSAALTSGWSYVVLTDNPEKKAAAVEYLQWLTAPERMAAWARAAQLVPASKSAFVDSIEPSEYATTLWALLENGIVAPSFAQQAPYGEAWHTAVQGVLNGLVSPDDAAFGAVQTLSQ